MVVWVEGDKGNSLVIVDETLKSFAEPCVVEVDTGRDGVIVPQTNPGFVAAKSDLTRLSS
jgi:hypothetical protein